MGIGHHLWVTGYQVHAGPFVHQRSLTGSHVGWVAGRPLRPSSPGLDNEEELGTGSPARTGKKHSELSEQLKLEMAVGTVLPCVTHWKGTSWNISSLMEGSGERGS